MAHVNGARVFIPYTVPGDTINASIEGSTGTLEEMRISSSERVSAPCPHFTQCGGCSLQHVSDRLYSEFKHNLLLTPLRLQHIPTNTVRPLLKMPTASRRRVEWKVSYQHSPVAMGYYASKSHRLTDISSCQILDPALQNLILPFKEQLALLSPVIAAIQATALESGIDMMIKIQAPLTSSDREALIQFSKTHSLSRLTIQLGEAEYEMLYGTIPLLKLGIENIALPPAIFLQATQEAQQLITDHIIHELRSVGPVVDLFAGIGTYSFPLAAHAKIHAVEGNSDMVKAIKTARCVNVTAECRDLFRTPLTSKELASYKAAILNPPRAGAKNQVEHIARSPLKKLMVISCNPATFSRDARILMDAGFTMNYAQPIDQFIYSPHLEVLAAFSR